MKMICYVIKNFGWVLVLLTLPLIAACAGRDIPRAHEAGHHGPPPEAIEACKGHAEGDMVTIKTPWGHEMTAVCKKIPEQLIAVPEGAPFGQPGKGCLRKKDS